MTSTAENPPQHIDRQADIDALTEAISLAPLGVLPSQTITQLIFLRDRLSTPPTGI